MLSRIRRYFLAAATLALAVSKAIEARDVFFFAGLGAIAVGASLVWGAGHSLIIVGAVLVGAGLFGGR